ncbi:hypothetical protein H8356DRAFT_1303995 [Neocallimastix lanati (nom. inval.)]|jgi:predicted esterase|uniref:Alpha/beta-hydrolase n=1 Tax=Neocallimastix californiae TaxID=1754190 RepID=A0A1Y2FTN0_9FUNG|nr:hypothetical protein H8356DRAFT_1303995 [Neocallimastix sp. JGI-2020a]ORY87338.1 hypothetical protein LY90DRAFT_663048 [Neocallimastix californiae]|eukprot:ORY87338.1 hypothetical protein LY90DRAFT_663048 [Neocallimastix californiae]
MKFLNLILYTFTVLLVSAWGKSIGYTSGAINAGMVVQGYEWGPAVPKVVVEFDDIVSGFNKDTFVVKTGGSQRQVLDVYNTDANGVRQPQNTNFLAIEMRVNTIYLDFLGASMGDACPFSYNMETGRNVWADDFQLELDLAPSMSFKVGETEYGTENAWTTFTKNLMENYIVPETVDWKKDTFTDGVITLHRASFTPKGAEIDGVKNPLIIWLHGAGEGGADTDITLLGNEVIALAKEGIQKYFKNAQQAGAYVLAVQTPTMWMDKGDGTYNDSIEAGQKQTSYYDSVLIAAIQDYVRSNSDIDTNRIYLGGCSNGGYMTMNLMFEHGEYFSAYYPICEAYMSKNISDEMIEQAKNNNIWFLQSEDDTTVNPLASTIPTFYRLLNAGAQNVHFTLTDKVRGEDDPEAHYMGHYSWIYAFNDDVKKEFDNSKALADVSNVVIEDGTGLVTSTNNYVTNANCSKPGNMWAWLAQQTKPTSY